MTTEQQNKAWESLPEEAKVLVRNLCRTSHIPQYETVLCFLFGESNLSAPDTEPTATEGEEKEPKHGTITIPIKADIDDACYETLRIDLAAKIAVAYAEKGRYEPEDIGARAVKVANEVVERLKKSKA